MPRRSGVVKRSVLPDPIYGSVIVTKLVNQIMLDGKRDIAQKIVYDALKLANEKLSAEPMDILTKAIENASPLLETKARRVGGSNYQVPMEVRPDRRQTLAIRWLTTFSRARNERTMDARLAGELVDAYNGAGGAVKRKEEMHRMADANKAFAHYKW